MNSYPRNTTLARLGDGRLAIGVFVLVSLCLFIAALTRDMRLPLWTDELLTLFMSQQPTVSDLFTAIREGADGQPPLYDLIVRGLRPVLVTDSLRVRLPSTIGFFLMCVCVFVFVRKRLPALYAMLAALVAVRLAWPYSFEGRAYGIVLGCVSLALVCWQAAVQTGSMRAHAGLTLSLACAIAFHYFAVFVVCGFLAAGSIRWWKLRKIEFRLLTALILPLMIIPLHLPFIRASQPFQKYFWSKAKLSTLYSYYLETLSPLAVVILLSALCALFVVAWRIRRPQLPVLADYPLWTDEWIVGLGLVILPGVVIVTTLLTSQAFIDRYVLWSAIGVGVCLALALHKLVHGNRSVAVVVVLPLLLWCMETAFKAAIEPPRFRYAGDLPLVIQNIPSEPKPVVITYDHAFMELWFYSRPDLQQRLVYLIDQDLERRYAHTDTTSRIFSPLRRRVPVGVVDFDSFIAMHSRFLLAGGHSNWIVAHLHQLNYRFELLKDGGDNKVYEVSAPY